MWEFLSQLVTQAVSSLLSSATQTFLAPMAQNLINGPPRRPAVMNIQQMPSPSAFQQIAPSLAAQSPAVAQAFPETPPTRPEPSPAREPTAPSEPAPPITPEVPVTPTGAGQPTRPSGTLAFQGGFTGGPPAPTGAGTGPIPTSPGFTTLNRPKKPSGFQAI